MSNRPALKVVDLPVTNQRDPGAQLRAIADQIDRGEFGEVGTLAVALLGNTMEVFGGGTDYTAPSVALLMRAASLRMEKAIEEHGR